MDQATEYPQTVPSATEGTGDTSAIPLGAGPQPFQPFPAAAEPAPAPAPQVGSPDYDWSAHYDTTDLFHYSFADGTQIAIRSFASIYSKTWLYKVSQMVKEGATDVDIEFAAIDRAACPTARELLLNLDDTEGDPINDLWLAWVASGTKPAPTAPDDAGLAPGKLPG